MTVLFKDGSRLTVGAWATTDDESGRFEEREYAAGRRFARRREVSAA